MKVLVAIVSCHALADRRQAIRDTWLPELAGMPGFDYKFFLGKPSYACGTSFGDGTFCVNDKDKCPGGTGHMWTGTFGDTIMLDADDSYRGLPAKTKAIAQYALANGYSHVFKCDDDVYLQPKRLYESDFAQLGHYVGRKRGPSGGFPAPYASGFSYWLDRTAMLVIAEAPLSEDPAEDRWAGNALLRAGILCTADYRYAVVTSQKNTCSFNEGPRKGNPIISACEFVPERMGGVHREWLTRPSLKIVKQQYDEHILASVAVVIKTFLRDGYLRATVRGLEENLPEAKIVIVDDGYESSFKIGWYSALRLKGHSCLWLPFDSGFGAKANEAVNACDREYVLIASDDFNFTMETRLHVTNMARMLRRNEKIDIISGRVNGNAYESCLTIDGDRVIETAGYHATEQVDGISYKLCDLTVNFSLIRRTLLERVRWDEGVKIGGGEHGAFFLDVKRAGGVVAYLPGANIREWPKNSDWMHPTYPAMRNRARTPGRQCLVNRGIRQWVLQDGQVEETGL